jgi:hypothetical protein
VAELVAELGAELEAELGAAKFGGRQFAEPVAGSFSHEALINIRSA